jgi:hypothetical protein
VRPSAEPTPASNIVAQFSMSQTVDSIPAALVSTDGDDDASFADSIMNNAVIVNVLSDAVASAMDISSDDVTLVSVSVVHSEVSSATSRLAAAGAYVERTFARKSEHVSVSSVSISATFSVQFMTEGNDMTAVTSKYNSLVESFSTAVSTGAFTVAIQERAESANMTALMEVSASQAPTVESSPTVVGQHVGSPTYAPTAAKVAAAASSSALSVGGTAGVVIAGSVVLLALIGVVMAYRRYATDSPKKRAYEQPPKDKNVNVRSSKLNPSFEGVANNADKNNVSVQGEKPRRKSRASIIIDSIEAQEDNHMDSLPSPYGIKAKSTTSNQQQSQQKRRISSPDSALSDAASARPMSPSVTIGSPPKLTPVATELSSSPTVARGSVHRLPLSPQQSVRRSTNSTGDAVVGSVDVGQKLPSRRSSTRPQLDEL